LIALSNSEIDLCIYTVVVLMIVLQAKEADSSRYKTSLSQLEVDFLNIVGTVVITKTVSSFLTLK